MMLSDIILDDKKSAGEISTFLIEQKYALQTHIEY